MYVTIILKEDETPTSIGGELQQFRLGGSLIFLQDKASGGSQAWSVEECFAFDHAAARTPEAFLNYAQQKTPKSKGLRCFQQFQGESNPCFRRERATS